MFYWWENWAIFSHGRPHKWTEVGWKSDPKWFRLFLQKKGREFEDNHCSHFPWSMQWFLTCVKTSSPSQGTFKEISETQAVIVWFAVTDRCWEGRKRQKVEHGAVGRASLPLCPFSGLSAVLSRAQSSAAFLPLAFPPLTCRHHRGNGVYLTPESC